MLIFAFLCALHACAQALPLPTAAQVAWQQGEIMALVHFNMATFFRDGDPGCSADNWQGATGSSNPDSFAPSALNVSQWVDSMVAIKATEAVLTAKRKFSPASERTQNAPL
jgi:alpha-L-fucosidase